MSTALPSQDGFKKTNEDVNCLEIHDSFIFAQLVFDDQ
jgi:hypothetical protein